VRAKELGAVLPEAWDVPFARALDVDPARRPRSIAELAASFERASRGETALEPPPVSLPRFEVLTDASATAAAAAPASVPSTPPEASPAEPARARRGRWIAIGSAAIALLGAGLFVAIRMAPPPATARAATPSSPAPSSSVPAPEASTAVTATPVVATPSAAPSASTSATRPSPAAPPSAPVVPDPGMSTLLVTCNPACDSIWVDGHLAPDASSGKTVTPGVHMIGANLARHPSKVQAVLCKRGQIARFGVDFSP
jgi:hypothetical protein